MFRFIQITAYLGLAFAFGAGTQILVGWDGVACLVAGMAIGLINPK